MASLSALDLARLTRLALVVVPLAAFVGCAAPASEAGVGVDDVTSGGEGEADEAATDTDGGGAGSADAGDAGAADGGASAGLNIDLDGITWSDDGAYLLQDHVFGGGGAATGDSYVPPTEKSLHVGFMVTLKAASGGTPYLTPGRYLCDTAGKPFSGERLPIFRSYFDLTYKGAHYEVTKDGSCVLEVTSDADGADGKVHIVGTLTGEVEKKGQGPVQIHATFDLPYGHP